LFYCNYIFQEDGTARGIEEEADTDVSQTNVTAVIDSQNTDTLNITKGDENSNDYLTEYEDDVGEDLAYEEDLSNESEIIGNGSEVEEEFEESVETHEVSDEHNEEEIIAQVSDYDYDYPEDNSNEYILNTPIKVDTKQSNKKIPKKYHEVNLKKLSRKTASAAKPLANDIKTHSKPGNKAIDLRKGCSGSNPNPSCARPPSTPPLKAQDTTTTVAPREEIPKQRGEMSILAGLYLRCPRCRRRDPQGKCRPILFCTARGFYQMDN